MSSFLTTLSVLKQRATENPVLVSAGLAGYAALGAIDALRGRRHPAVTAFSQVHRSTRHELMRRAVEPYIIANRDVTYALPDIAGRESVTSYFGNRIAVLKEPGPKGERGVLFVMFTE